MSERRVRAKFTNTQADRPASQPRASAKRQSVAVTARSAVIEEAPRYDRAQIASLRGKLNLSQAVFAGALNVSPETVRAWEQGKRVPDGAALRLLQIADEHPQWVLETVRSSDYNASSITADSENMKE